MMKVNQMKLRVGDLVKGYVEDASTNGVTAWGGRLVVRPSYQREFVYDDKKQSAVLNTVLNGFPLNIMYFVNRGDGTYEVLDGQQRIISICRFVTNSAISIEVPDRVNGGVNPNNWPNLYPEQQQSILDYELDVYVCEGTEAEKLEWFQIINIAGEVLEKQEIRNALHGSKWLTDAKSMCSRVNGPVVKRYGKYFNGAWLRQKFLETALDWYADAEGVEAKDRIAEVMREHEGDASADGLWNYLESVFGWVEGVFGPFDKNMKGVEWGLLYNRHRGDMLDPASVQVEVAGLVADDEVQRKKKVYEYVLEGEAKVLNLRSFSDSEKATMYARQDGKCVGCGLPFPIEKMHGDHIVPWSSGGRTRIAEVDDPALMNNTQNGNNGQMLCASCNLAKSDG